MEFDARFEDRIVELIAQATPARHRNTRITREMRLHHDLGIDSLGMVALVFRLEQAFSVDLAELAPEIDVRRLRTVQDMIDVSRQILQQAGAR